jgi:hypothetical protein
VCRVDQCIGPDPQFWDSLICTENCRPVSSDADVLNINVCILYKLMITLLPIFLHNIKTLKEGEGDRSLEQHRG